MIAEGIFSEVDRALVKHWEGVCNPYAPCFIQDVSEFAHWLAFLDSRKAVVPVGTYLEIGCASGFTLRFVKQALPDFQFVAIDDGQHFQSDQLRAWLQTKPDRVNVHFGDSHSEGSARWLSEHGNMLSYAFVDGDHSTPGVRKDLALVTQHLSPTGFIACHDAMDKNVQKAFAEVTEAKELKSVGFVYHDALPYMGIRVFQKV